MLRDRRPSARQPRFGTRVKLGWRPTQWVTTLRVAANRKASCAPEMDPELPDEPTLGSLCTDRAVLGSPSLPAGTGHGDDNQWPMEPTH